MMVVILPTIMIIDKFVPTTSDNRSNVTENDNDHQHDNER